MQPPHFVSVSGCGRFPYLLLPALNLAVLLWGAAAATSGERGGCHDTSLMLEKQVVEVERLRRELQVAETALIGLRGQVESDIGCQVEGADHASFMQFKVGRRMTSGLEVSTGESHKPVEPESANHMPPHSGSSRNDAEQLEHREVSFAGLDRAGAALTSGTDSQAVSELCSTMRDTRAEIVDVWKSPIPKCGFDIAVWDEAKVKFYSASCQPAWVFIHVLRNADRTWRLDGFDDASGRCVL